MVLADLIGSMFHCAKQLQKLPLTLMSGVAQNFVKNTVNVTMDCYLNMIVHLIMPWPHTSVVHCTPTASNY